MDYNRVCQIRLLCSSRWCVFHCHPRGGRGGHTQTVPDLLEDLALPEEEGEGIHIPDTSQSRSCCV